MGSRRIVKSQSTAITTVAAMILLRRAGAKATEELRELHGLAYLGRVHEHAT